MTKIIQKREGNTIQFYRDGGFNAPVACLIDGHSAVIFDPMADNDALFLGAEVIDQSVFDRLGLTVNMIRNIDAMRVPDIRPENAA